MKIIPINVAGDCRQSGLERIKASQISKILGFKPNISDDPSKVVNSWGFSVDGENYGIWDYKGSHRYGCFSTFGSPDVFKKLFGDHWSKN